MSSLNTDQEIALEHYNEQFQEALDTEDAGRAFAIIEDMRRYGYHLHADHFAEDLGQQEWYCFDCLGTGVIEEGEADNLVEKTCHCKLD